jgi:hypothetical protein
MCVLKLTLVKIFSSKNGLLLCIPLPLGKKVLNRDGNAVARLLCVNICHE